MISPNLKQAREELEAMTQKCIATTQRRIAEGKLSADKGARVIAAAQEPISDEDVLEVAKANARFEESMAEANARFEEGEWYQRSMQTHSEYLDTLRQHHPTAMTHVRAALLRVMAAVEIRQEILGGAANPGAFADALLQGEFMERADVDLEKKRLRAKRAEFGHDQMRRNG